MKTNTPAGTARTLLRRLFCLPLLASPLAAQNTNRLILEQSTDLQAWQTVPLAPAMLAANGKILVPSATPGNFYRMQVEVLSPPADLVLIPAGSFTMGRTSGDTDGHAPPVTVNVSAFYIGKYEVTKALWDEVRTWGLANGYIDLSAGEGKAATHPVQTISWFDILKWCNARSEKEGITPVYTVSGAVMKTGTAVPVANWTANGYRIPTETEWEKAALGGVSGKRFPWGTDTISHSQANYLTSPIYSYDLSGAGYVFHPSFTAGEFPYTSPVGSFEANGYSLHDMAGNVSEWCWDWYDASTYLYVSGATDPRGASSGLTRMQRGGGWSTGAINCRVADRGASNPGNSVNFLGAGIARSSVP